MKGTQVLKKYILVQSDKNYTFLLGDKLVYYSKQIIWKIGLHQ